MTNTISLLEEQQERRATVVRPSWPATWMAVAEVISWRATCPRLRNGAVVVDKDNQLLVTGFNGAPRGQDHCDKVGCLIEGGHCVRAIHAEQNCITQAARLGVGLYGGSLYTIYRPCIRCTLLLVQTGLRFVFYKHGYDSDESLGEVTRLLKSSDIGLFAIGDW